MIRRRAALRAAGLAAAVLLAAGCVKLHRIGYRLPGTALLPLAAKGVEDRSAEYGGLFCSVLRHVGTEGGPWGGCADYIETPGPDDLDLPPLPADTGILVIPGLLGQCLSPEFQAFSDALAHLREKHGVAGEYLDVPAMGSCEHNAGIIADHLRKRMAAGSGKSIVVGYSKGASDVMVMLAAYPETREAVAALLTVASPVGGSRLPDMTPDSVPRILDRLGPDRCDMGDGGGIESLRRSVRQAFLREHPAPIVPTYSLVAVSDETTTSRALKPLWRKLSLISLDQDAQVISSEGIPPGARFLGVLWADHWAVGMPFELGEHAVASKMVDHNHFPRTALLEAAVRMVVADLAGPPSPSSPGDPPAGSLPPR